MKNFTLGVRGGKIQSFSHQKKEKKKLPKCVSGQLESFKTHLFLGEKKGVPPILCHFGPNFMNFATFSKYFAILGGKRKKIFFTRSAQKWILIKVYFHFFCFFSHQRGKGGLEGVCNFSHFFSP